MRRQLSSAKLVANARTWTKWASGHDDIPDIYPHFINEKYFSSWADEMSDLLLLILMSVGVMLKPAWKKEDNGMWWLSLSSL